MKTKELRRAKVGVQIGVVALVGAALFFTVASACTYFASGTGLGARFTITSSVSSSPTSQIPALLNPGVQRYLWYTVHNPQKVPITVNSMRISDVSAPAGCPMTNLNMDSTTFSGSLVVPAQGTNSVAVPISLLETNTNQDACENRTFKFTYAGTATYAEVYATSTNLESSMNPSSVGHVVTYTATVTADADANQDPVPSSPTGTVTFKDDDETICSVPVISSGHATSVATCPSPDYSTSGTHQITALYSNVDGNFSASTSPTLDQVVQRSPIATWTTLVSAPNPSGLGSAVTLTASVSSSPNSPSSLIPTGAVNFYSGSPSGLHELIGATSLEANGKATYAVSSLPTGTNSLYAVYSGDTAFLASTSPVISQVVIGPPSKCGSTYPNWFMGQPNSPVIAGTAGNFFVYAPSGNYQLHGFDGNNCFVFGDGNNVIDGGNGNDVVQVGNGNNNIAFGDGDDVINAGDGVNHVSLGNGNDTVTLGDGSSNEVALGSGNDVVTIEGGDHDIISGGNGNETIYLGDGSYNTFIGVAHQVDICYLPVPPESWHGTAANYYHDTITNCSVANS